MLRSNLLLPGERKSLRITDPSEIFMLEKFNKKPERDALFGIMPLKFLKSDKKDEASNPHTDYRAEDVC